RLPGPRFALQGPPAGEVGEAPADRLGPRQADRAGRLGQHHEGERPGVLYFAGPHRRFQAADVQPAAPQRRVLGGRAGRAGAGKGPPLTRNAHVDKQKLIAIDTAALPWEERFNEKLGRALFRKNLITDPDTGMEVRMVRYPAGVINVRHTHPCAHGMYVLEGTLVTHAGSYGPGGFGWVPGGAGIGDGASPARPRTALFL